MMVNNTSTLAEKTPGMSEDSANEYAIIGYRVANTKNNTIYTRVKNTFNMVKGHNNLL